MEELYNMVVTAVAPYIAGVDMYMVAAGAVLAALVAIAKLTKTNKDNLIVAKIVAVFNKIKSYLPKKVK